VGFIASSVAKDLRRHRRNPLDLLIWIGIPLIVGALMVLIFGGSEGPKPQAHVLVADLDQSVVSGLLIGALSQEAVGDFIRAEEVALADGRSRVADGKATALLIIPQGFSSAFLREEPATLRLITNPAERILPEIVEEMLSVFADAHFYLHRLIGGDLKAMAQGPPPGAGTFDDALISGMSTRINHIMGRLSRLMNPRLIRLVAEPAAPPKAAGAEAGAQGETASGDETGAQGAAQAEEPGMGLLLLPSILFMALLFMAQGLGNEFWEEKRRHTLKRTLVSPRGVRAFLAGKLITALILIGVVCLVALLIGYAYLSLDFASLPLALVWTSLAGLALAAGMTTLQLLAWSQRAANIIGMAIIFPLMMLGGSFFPFEAMPSWMQVVGRLTPNGWALSRLKAILLGETGAGGLLPAMAVLLAAIGLLSLVNAWRLRARVEKG